MVTVAAAELVDTDAIKALQISLTADEMARAGAHPTEHVDAYQAYLRGRNALRGKPGADIVKAAIDDFDKAIKSDPLFALAYTGIADASLRMYRDTKDDHMGHQGSVGG